MAGLDLEGVVAILLTPFDHKERVGVESLQREVEFNIHSGVKGLGVALGSEILKLTESERDLVIRTVVNQVRGRVPVVVNTGAQGTAVAIFYSKRAEELGADAIMVSPPFTSSLSGDALVSYYRDISQAVGLPIVIQDHPSGPVPPSLLPRIVQECPKALFCKVEVAPTPRRVAQAVQEAGGKLKVLGGAGGLRFISELRRGAIGTMPFASQPSAFVRVLEAFRRGRPGKASNILRTEVIPLFHLVAKQPDLVLWVQKELLVRKNIFKTACVRSPSGQPDDATREKINAVIENVLSAEAMAVANS